MQERLDPSPAFFPQQTSWDVSRLHEIGPALRQHLLPLLPLKETIHLSSASRDWHYLVMETTPVHQLSPHARSTLLPKGLTSHHPIRQVLQRQAQLLGRLRQSRAYEAACRKQGLTYRGFLAQTSPSLLLFGMCEEARPEDHAHAGQISWQPQASLEEPSQCILLWPNGEVSQPQPFALDLYLERPTVIDDTLSSAEAASFQTAERLDALPPYTASHIWNTAWLADGRHFVMQSGPHEGQEHPTSILKVVDTLSHASTTICMRGLHGFTNGRPGLIAPQSKLLLWIDADMGQPNSDSTQHAEDGAFALHEAHQEQVIALSLEHLAVKTQPPLYRLCCPPPLASSGQPNELNQRRVGCVALAPYQQLLAVHWASWTPSFWTGISLHKSSTGECVSSARFNHPLGIQTDAATYTTLHWGPCGSYLLVASSNGVLTRMDAACSMTWQSRVGNRGIGPQFASGTESTWPSCTSFSHVSPCARFVFVADTVIATWDQTCGMFIPLRVRLPQLVLGSILQSASGKLLHQFAGNEPLSAVQWSASGDVCLVPEHAMVISAFVSEAASPTCHTLRLAGACRPETLGLKNRAFESCELKLSPCGTVVVGLIAVGSSIVGRVQLQHWQLPHPPLTAQNAVTLQPTVISGINMQVPSIASLVWHPQQNACMYALGEQAGGLHLVDGRTNRAVESWSAADLEVPEFEQSAKSCAGHWCLAWSPDGHRLAVFCHGTGIILHFLSHSQHNLRCTWQDDCIWVHSLEF